MKLGKEAMEKLRAEITGKLSAGDELVVIGAVALRGTRLIAEREYAFLRNYFSKGFLFHCRILEEEYGIQETPANREGTADMESISLLALKAGASALYIMGEGGVLSALWKMAEASQVGLAADLRRIPIRQETIEICEHFDLNPYYLRSEGALLAGVPRSDALVRELERIGVPWAVIGRTNHENSRILYSGVNVRYLDRPAADEIYKMKWYAPQNGISSQLEEIWQN